MIANIKLALGFILIASAFSVPCFAPANTWGAPCVAPTPIAGVKGTYVNYHVSVLNSTNVYCRAVGMANYIHGTQCFWGWHDLGIVNNQYVSLIWDSQNSYPSIQCYGTPSSANLDWGFSSGVSTLTCQRADFFSNKFSFDNEKTVTLSD